MLVTTRMLLLSLYFSFSTSRSSQLMLGTGISKATALCPRLAIFPVNNAMNPLGVTGHYPIHSLTLVHKGPVFKPKTSGGSRASKPTCHNHLEPYFCPVCACSNRVLLYTMPCCIPLPRKSLGIPTQMSASCLLPPPHFTRSFSTELTIWCLYTPHHPERSLARRSNRPPQIFVG